MPPPLRSVAWREGARSWHVGQETVGDRQEGRRKKVGKVAALLAMSIFSPYK